MVHVLRVAQVLLPGLLEIASSQEHWGGVLAPYMLLHSAHDLLPHQVLQELQARDSHIEIGSGLQVAQVLLPGLLVIASSKEHRGGVLAPACCCTPRMYCCLTRCSRSFKPETATLKLDLACRWRRCCCRGCWR